MMHASTHCGKEISPDIPRTTQLLTVMILLARGIILHFSVAGVSYFISFAVNTFIVSKT